MHSYVSPQVNIVGVVFCSAKKKNQTKLGEIGERGGVCFYIRLNKRIHFLRPIDFHMSNKGQWIS